MFTDVRKPWLRKPLILAACLPPIIPHIVLLSNSKRRALESGKLGSDVVGKLPLALL
jgi:hypothetical protein